MSDVEETLQPLAARVVALENAVESLILAVRCFVDHRDRASDDVLELVGIHVTNATFALEGRNDD